MTSEKILCCIVVLLISIKQIVGPPAVIKNKEDTHKEKDHAVQTNEVEDMMNESSFDVEYKRYLDEIVKTLETDEEFKKKVEASDVDHVSSGNIARELEMVNHHVRSKLDELKRHEVQRLRDLVKKKEELGHGPLHPSEYEHIDHLNLETFEVKDLDKLIKKVSKDMEKINELRRDQFKQYEMEKHFEEQVTMKNMTDKEKEEYKAHLEEAKVKHANHEKIHHPGSKAQFEEVWEKQDHLENQEFDPKIFFHLHDIDSNGYWDQEEVKALFIEELNKMYEAGLPEDDMKERQEEMERMTEHVFKEMDKNGDSLISYKEYMDETKSKDFNQDEGWETLDKQQLYSQQEYENFERRRIAEVRKMVEQGLIPPEHYAGILEQHAMPHVQQYDPNQMHYYPNQVDQQGYHPNQIQQQGYHPNQAPQQGYPNQMPHHPNQMPHHPNQMQQHPNQMPQHPNQMQQHPNQMQQHPNQVQHPNQMQHHPNQVQHPNQMQQHPNQVQHPNQMQQHPNQVQHPNQISQHPSIQQQNHAQQGYQQNQHSNQIPAQQYHPNQVYQPNQSEQQNQKNQPNQFQNNQLPSQQQNQDSQQQYQQQPHNNQQQYQQQPQNNQQQYQQQPQNNQQQYQQQNQNNQKQVKQPASVQPPASRH